MILRGFAKFERCSIVLKLKNVTKEEKLEGNQQSIKATIIFNKFFRKTPFLAQSK